MPDDASSYPKALGMTANMPTASGDLADVHKLYGPSARRGMQVVTFAAAFCEFARLPVGFFAISTPLQ
jgi:hypothetical protein